MATPMTDDPPRPLAGIDISAIQDAVDALDAEDIRVDSIDDITRDDDGTVHWQMALSADTRHTSINDFD